MRNRASFFAILCAAALALLIAPAGGELLNTGCCTGGGGGGSSGGGSSDAWDPLNMAAGITLSNSNRTATRDATNDTWLGLRSLSSKSSGLLYWKQTIGATHSNNGWIGGIGQAAWNTTGYPGASSFSAGNQLNNGSNYVSGVGVVFTGTNCQNFAAGTTNVDVWWAVNFTTLKVWCTVAGCATWAGSSSPDADGGNQFTIPAGTYYIIWSGNRAGGTTDISTLNTAPDTAACAGISTFTAWGT